MPQSATRGAVNNTLAAGDRDAAQRSNAGRGFSRGRGQQYMDSVRGGIARASAEGEAFQTAAQDTFANANARAAFSQNNRDYDLAMRRLEEQRQQNAWDSSFNNMTSIWGALTGLMG